VARRPEPSYLPRRMRRSPRLVESFFSLAALATVLLAACGSPFGGLTGGDCLSADSSSCTCFLESGNTPTGAACSSSSVSNGVCCADLGWPGKGLTCTCNSYSCRQTAPDGSCSCGTELSGPNPTCAPKPGFTCCQHVHSDCDCGPNAAAACDVASGDHVELSCTRDTATCSSSSQAVTGACH
jgi:hypothetical protein